MTDYLNGTKIKVTNFLQEKPDRITAVSLERRFVNQENDRTYRK
jgi:hypothetical protein